MVNISCIVPAFKRVDQTLHTLALLYESDGVGSMFTLEVIVADSTPDTSLKDAIFSSFGERVRYIQPTRTGIAANKNAGAKAATHPIIIFCDSDMEVEPNTILNSIDSLKSHETAGMTGGVVLWRGGPNDGHKDRPRSEDRMVRRVETMYIEALYSRFVVTYKKVFLDVGGYDEGVFNMRGEGSDLSARYWRAGYPLVFDESIVVHHVHDVPDAAAVRVDHAEWGIAKDLFLLSYKYSMLDRDYNQFASTVAMNFAPLGSRGSYRMLQGIAKHYDDIIAAKPTLDAFRASDKPAYDFKFLEVFTNVKAFDVCIDAAKSRIADAREVFGA